MLKCSVWAIGALTLAATSVCAQEAGQIVGNVRDGSGAVIPTVKVTAGGSAQRGIDLPEAGRRDVLLGGWPRHAADFQLEPDR